MKKATAGSAYDYRFTSLVDGLPLLLAEYRGKVILVVNTASECGFTPQYEGLQELHAKYKDRGLVILGVPSNDFGGQEAGSNETIGQFCQARFGVGFPMTGKEHVRGGGAHPFYLWAKDTLGWRAAPKWNFHKYVIDRHGRLVDYFHSPRKPDSAAVMKTINRLLAEN